MNFDLKGTSFKNMKFVSNYFSKCIIKQSYLNLYYLVSAKDIFYNIFKDCILKYLDAQVKDYLEKNQTFKVYIK